MNYLAPSVLAADFSKLGEEIKTATDAGAKIIHLDVMDGSFVPNISFGVPVITSVRKRTDVFFDVHLMVKEPMRFLAAYMKAGADMMTVHYEACKDVAATLQAIKDLGVKVGLAIAPDTPVDVIRPYMSILDMILIMSVYPGFGGQSFMELSLDRIRDVRSMVTETGRDIWVEVDGGIDCSNISTILEAGANVFVAGSAVFGGDITENIKNLTKFL